jgi:1-acyl-sn-glycerol-3-phosphate acyltransferase
MSSGLYTLLSIPVFGILYLYTAIGIFILIPFTWLNARRVIQLLSQAWAKSVFMVLCKRLQIAGKENFARDEKYIVVANHASLFDIVAIMSFFPEVSWFGHERLLRIPVFGRFLKLTDYVPFKEPTVTNTRHMLEQLIKKANTKSVALFPEGTRTLDGKVNPFYRGFIHLFRTRDIEILPVTLNGFYNLKPKNRFYIDFGSNLNIVIHKPIPREKLICRKDHEIVDAVKSIIESAYYQE